MAAPPPSPPPSSRPVSSPPPPLLTSSSSPQPSSPSDSTPHSSPCLQPPEIVDATTLQHLALPPLKNEVSWPPETVQLTAPAIGGASSAQEQSFTVSETEQVIPMGRPQPPLPKDGAPRPPSMDSSPSSKNHASLFSPSAMRESTMEHLVVRWRPETVQLIPPAIRGISPKNQACSSSPPMDVSESPKNQSSSSLPPAMGTSTIQSITPPPKVFKYRPQLPPLTMVPPTFRSTGLFKDLPPPKYNKYMLFIPPPPPSTPPSTKDKLVLPPPRSTSPTTSPLPVHDDDPLLILPQELRKLIFSLMTAYKWYSIRPILNWTVDFLLHFIYERMQEDDDDAGEDFDF